MKRLGSYHSRSTVMGEAILIAAKELIAQIRRRPRACCSAASNVTYQSGVVTSKQGGSIELRGWAGASATGDFLQSQHTHTYGSHAVHLTVDPGPAVSTFWTMWGSRCRTHHQSADPAVRPWFVVQDLAARCWNGSFTT